MLDLRLKSTTRSPRLRGTTARVKSNEADGSRQPMAQQHGSEDFDQVHSATHSVIRKSQRASTWAHVWLWAHAFMVDVRMNTSTPRRPRTSLVDGRPCQAKLCGPSPPRSSAKGPARIFVNSSLILAEARA